MRGHTRKCKVKENLEVKGLCFELVFEVSGSWALPFL